MVVKVVYIDFNSTLNTETNTPCIKNIADPTNNIL